MKKVLVAATALAAWVSTSFGGIGVNWTAGGRVYGGMFGGEYGIAAYRPVTWQLVWAGPNGVADGIDSLAEGWVGGDDVVLAVREVPAGGGLASDGTEWDACLAKVGGDSLYEDLEWVGGDGYVFQRIWENPPPALPGEVYYESGLFPFRGTYCGGQDFPDVFGAATGSADGVVRATLWGDPSGDEPGTGGETESKYTITVGKGVEYVDKSEAAAGETVEVYTACPIGYRLEGVYVNGELIEGTAFIMPACDVTVTAVFVEDWEEPWLTMYTITTENGVETDRSEAAAGETVSAWVNMMVGMELEGIYVNGERVVGGTFTMPACDVTVTAVWVEITEKTETVDGVLWRFRVCDGEAIVTGVESPGGDLTVPVELGGVSVTEIGESAFGGCRGGESVTIPWCDKMRIGERAFEGCDLAWVSISGRTVEVWERAFEGGNLWEVMILGGDVALDRGAFYGCSVRDVEISGDVVKLEEYVFSECPVENVTISGYYDVFIGDEVFSGCSGLAEFTVPDSVSSLGTNVFEGCSGLETLSVPGAWKGTEMLVNAGVPAGCQVVYRTGAQVVTYHGNGGAPATQVRTNTVGDVYGTMPTATWAGHGVFAGWWTAASGGEKVTSNSVVTAAAKRELWAHWTTEQVTTFKGNGGAPATQKTTNTIGTAYGTMPEVERDGWTFAGWWTQTNGGTRVYATNTVTTAGTRTLHAQWTEIPKTLALELATDSVREDAGSVRCVVRRTGPLAGALAVSVGSSRTGDVSVPATVTIPAGARVASFLATVVDNAVLDGERTAVVTVSAAGYGTASAELTVLDDEIPGLLLEAESGSVREGGTLRVLVSREGSTENVLTVQLSGFPSSGRVEGPSSVVIDAGARSAVFEVSVPNNDTAQAEATVTLRAGAAGYKGATLEFLVLDDDVPGVRLELHPEAVGEGAGANAVRATLARTDTSKGMDQAIRVRLAASPSGQVVVPEEVVIPARTAEVRFGITPVDNGNVDGERVVTIDGQIMIASCGCGGQPSSGDAIRAVLTVLDNDVPALSLRAEPATMKEGLQEAGWLVLGHNSALAEDLTVALSYDTAGEIEIPATVTIPAGETEVRVPVKTLDDGVEDGAKLVSVYAEDPSGAFAGASTWLQVSDQNLPDLSVAWVEVPPTAVGGQRFAVRFAATNSGFAACARAVPYEVHVLRSRTVVPGSNTVAAAGTLQGGLAVGGTLEAELEVTAPELPGDAWVAVVLDPDGTVPELDNANNTGWSGAVGVAAAWTATVEADAETYLPGDAVTLAGKAQLAGGGAAAGVDVDVYLLMDGMRRTLKARTGSDGAFRTVFTPSAGEAGHYRAGACYPGAGSEAVQDEFDVLGMRRADSENVIWDIALGDSVARTVTLRNMSGVALTGLAAEFEGVPAGCGLSWELPDTLAAGGSATLKITATATGLTEQVEYERFSVRVSSSEGAVLEFPLYFHAQAQQAYLRASPSAIDTTMAVGHERYIDVTVVNDGKGDTGPVTATVPDVPWLKIVGGSRADNLASGESLVVSLMVAPEEGDGLTLNSPLRDGRLAVNCANGRGCGVALAFTPVSEATGSVVVDAVDNNTYTLESAPHLAGASVRINNPYTGELVAGGTTGEDGTWRAEVVPAGRYQLTVTAPNHETHAGEIDVEPGRTARTTAFLQYRLVSATWEVVRTEIEDQYDVQLVLDYETSVLAPLVRVTMPDQIDDLEVGEHTTFTVHLANTGLIAAENVILTFPEIEGHVFTLMDNNFKLPAGASRDIPVLFTNVGGAAPAARRKTATVLGTWIMKAIIFYICADREPSYAVDVRFKYGKTESVIPDPIPIGPGWNPYPTPTNRPPTVPIRITNSVPINVSTGSFFEAVGRIVEKGCQFVRTPCGESLVGCVADLIAAFTPGETIVECPLGLLDCATDLADLPDDFTAWNTTKAVYGCAKSVLGCIGLSQAKAIVLSLGGCALNVGGDCVPLLVDKFKPSGGTRYAVVVGCNEYDTEYIKSENFLDGCVPDATHIHELITNRGDWEAPNVTKLTDSDAKHDAIRAAISNVASQAVAGDTFLYFHASHGGNDCYTFVTNPPPYTNFPTIVYDVDPAGVKNYLCSFNTNYTAAEMAADLSAFDPGVSIVVMIDACHSAGMFKGDASPSGLRVVRHNAFGASRQFAAPSYFASAVTTRLGSIRRARGIRTASNVGFITAADFHEYSVDRGDGGAFTTAFTDGVSNGVCDGAVYGDQDGYATFYEGWNYAKEKARGESVGEQPDDCVSFVDTNGYALYQNSDRKIAKGEPERFYDYFFVHAQINNEPLLRTVRVGRAGDPSRAAPAASSDASDGGEAFFRTYPGFAAAVGTALAYDQAARNWFNEVFGDESWGEASGGELAAFLEICEGMLEEEGSRLSLAALSAASPAAVSQASLERFVARWNRYLAEGESGNDEWADAGTTDGVRPAYIAKCVQQLEICREEMGNWGYADLRDFLRKETKVVVDDINAQQQAVCASVELKLSQTLAMTREAFDGTLTMYNGHGTEAIRDLKLEVSVLDEDGVDRRDLFNPVFVGTAGDMAGADVLAGGMTVPAGGTGSATVRFIPERGAAPTEEKLYRFGGRVTYLDPFSGERAKIELVPVALTVSPSPYLKLDYFVQRDVYGDDPSTNDVVEASLPAELAVLVRNVGGGEARNVTIASAQPEKLKLEDGKDKGLEVDFRLSDYSLDRMALNGATAHLGLNTVALGNIAAGESRVAQWWLTSSLQGHFTGMKATVTPVNSWNTPDTALVDTNAAVHKLICSVVADADGLPDFLTSEEEDLYGLPDTIWLSSDGTAVDVAPAGSVSVSGSLGGGEATLGVAVAATVRGWTYGWAAVPGAERYEIVRVARSDGSEVPLRNAWITDRVFRDGADPKWETRLHIVDEGAAGNRAYTVTLQAKPGSGPAVVSFEGVQDGSVVAAPPNALTVVFSADVDGATFGTDDLVLKHQGGLVDVSGLSVSGSGTRWTISGLGSVCAADGLYQLVVQAAGIAGTDGVLGSSGRRISWTVCGNTTGPAVLGVARETGLQGEVFRVALSEAAASGSVTATLTRNGTSLAPGGIGWKDDGQGGLVLTGLESATAGDGTYVLTIAGSGLKDAAGHAGSGSASVSWTVDTVPPAAVRNLRIVPDRGASATDGTTCEASVEVRGTLAADAESVTVLARQGAGAETVLAGPLAPSGTNWTCAVELPWTGGLTLVVRCEDAAGNASDTPLEVFLDAVPAVASWDAVEAGTAPVDRAVLRFDPAVAAGDVTAARLRLERDGRQVPLKDSVTVSPLAGEASGTAFEVTGLAERCARAGRYVLRFDAGGVRKASSGLASPAGTGVSVEWEQMSPEVLVAGLSARQRYPWNGLVDIDYEVGGAGMDVAETWVEVTARNAESGSAMPLWSVTGDGADGPVAAGTHRLTWDMAADRGGEFVADVLSVTMAARRGDAAYLVVDMSGGRDAAQWPVSGLVGVPAGGWSDEYKTTKLVLRRVPAGTFAMGSPEDEAGRAADEVLHTVTLTRTYWMGVFEVTQKQWELAMGTRPAGCPGDMRPVEGVSWRDIRGRNSGAGWPGSGDVDVDSFLGVLREKTRLAFDLPTEAQWERACRAGSTAALNSGKVLGDVVVCAEAGEVAKYAGNGTKHGADDGLGGAESAHAVVGSYRPNAWGLYDMHGNVAEWCLDWIGDYRSGMGTDPAGPASGVRRAVRGGGWDDSAMDCRSASRGESAPGNANDDTGFRLCWVGDDVPAARAEQRIEWPAIGTAKVGDSVPLAAVAESGGPVAYEVVSGGASIEGNVLCFTATGTVVVRATQSGDDVWTPATAEQTIAVQEQVTLKYLTVSGTSRVALGESATYTCTAYYTDGTYKTVTPTWSLAAGASYGSITQDGVFTAKMVSMGPFDHIQVTIRATFDGRVGTRDVGLVAVPVELSISGASSVESGESATYTCTAVYSDGTSLTVTPTWSLVSGSSYGSITTGGVFTANGTSVQRSVTIQASFGGNTATKMVTVVPVVTGLSVSGASSVNSGGSATYTCTATYSDGTSKTVTPTWTLSAGSSYGSITTDGVFTANGTSVQRSVTIQASFGGQTATKTVTVVPVVTALTISGASSVNSGGSATYTCTATYSDGTSKAVTPTWSLSSGASYGSVTDGGVFTANGTSVQRSVTIKASFGGKTMTKTVTVVPVGAGTELVGEAIWKYILADATATVTGVEPAEGDLVIPSVLVECPVTGVGSNAFDLCSNLVSVVIPNGVTNIGHHAFSRCFGLQEVTIPESVTRIESSAFWLCENLSSVTIPDSVTDIGYHAFDFCQGLTSLHIGNSVTNIGGYAFDFCLKLSSVTIPDSVKTIGYSAFSACKGLTTLTIPDSVVQLDVHAFSYCDGLRSVAIGKNVSDIGDYAFWACTNLALLTIPDSVTNVGENAVGNCSALKTLSVPGAWEGTDKLSNLGVPEGCQVVYRGAEPLYMVVDLSGGTNAASYPVSYLADVPAGGWTDEYKTTKLVLRRIESGTFTMGSPTNELGRFTNEVPHQVALTQPFWMGVFEVTQKQWELVVGTKPSYFTNAAHYAARPVENVTYNDIRGSSAGAGWPSSSAVDAASFMGRLRARASVGNGMAWDLPTEAQWEYACRAGTTTALNSGKDLTGYSACTNMAEVGRYVYNGGQNYSSSCDTSAGTAKVGSYRPNGWGLYDMHGNVLEWCLDWYGSYGAGNAIDSLGYASGSNRVHRGGSWGGYALYCRSAYRGGSNPSYRGSNYGLRLCCSAGLP